MKATLTFSLPEDRDEHEVAVHAMDWKLVASSLDGWLRGCLKYGHSFDLVNDALEACRAELREQMESRGLGGEDL